jgi:hypothetical protein
MKNVLRFTVIAIACSLAGSAYAAQSSATDFSGAKRGSAYAAKKAECKREAKGKKFGIHLVERNRWINDCIAGRRT